MKRAGRPTPRIYCLQMERTAANRSCLDLYKHESFDERRAANANVQLMNIICVLKMQHSATLKWGNLHERVPRTGGKPCFPYLARYVWAATPSTPAGSFSSSHWFVRFCIHTSWSECFASLQQNGLSVVTQRKPVCPCVCNWLHKYILMMLPHPRNEQRAKRREAGQGEEAAPTPARWLEQMVRSKTSSPGIAGLALWARVRVDDVKDELTRVPPPVADIWLQVRDTGLVRVLRVWGCIHSCDIASLRVLILAVTS